VLTATLDLDARHPTLDDHRPGGLPLFGTAMSLNALAAAARRLGQIPANFAYEQVEINRPCILADGGTHRLTIRFRPLTGGVLGEVLTLNDGEADTLHLSAVLRASDPPETAGPDAAFITGPAVEAADIYAVFFHGTTFRVVDRVQYADGAMVTRLAAHPEMQHIPPIARLLEFGLQSAGLLEMATNDRMMIPHGIGRIVPGFAAESAHAAPIFALPRYGAGGAIDIGVIDAQRRGIMKIEAYRTVKLPFPSDTEAARRLGAKLRAVQEKTTPRSGNAR
jgi:hypothetical protein